MARIIYGVQGEGMGHATRSGILIKHLLKKHKVKIFSGDRAYKYLKTKFKDVNKIESQNIVYHNNKAAIFRTMLLNMKKSGGFIRSIRKVKKAIKTFKPDFIISDYEAITHNAAKETRTKLVHFDNQNDISLLRAKPSLKEFFSFLTTRIITWLFTWGGDVYLILSLNPGKVTKRKKYLHPLVKDDIRKVKPKVGKHVFVYQTSKSNQILIDILKTLDEKFVVYGFNVDKKEGNITFRKFNENLFNKDFSYSKAVILNGGFTTISEAVHVKKPILSIPVEGQFEQVYNAKTIEKLGFGLYIQKAEKKNIQLFLKNLENYRKNLKYFIKHENEQTLAKIDSYLQAYYF